MSKWTLGPVAAALLVALACAGGAEPAAPAAQPQPPQAPAQPAPAAPAADPQAPAVRAPVPSAPAPAAPAPPAAAKPKYGGAITTFVRDDPTVGFEPHVLGARTETRAVITHALETVAIWDTIEGQPCTFALRPLLAEGWRFVDPTTVEVRLRQGVKFQNVPPVNGRELVADDVVFSWKRLFDRGLQANLAKDIANIQAADQYTVRIKTKKPTPLITHELFAWDQGSDILAKEAAGGKGLYDKRENIIGTGPFLLADYTPGVGHVFRRNPNYWIQGRPYLDEIKMSIMRDASTRAAALQVGKLDFLEEMSLEEQERLVDRRAKVRFEVCQVGGSTFIPVNDKPPFNDVRVRRALSMAVDREAIVKGILRGQGSVLGVMAPVLPGALRLDEFPPEVRKYLQYNPAEAKKLLAEAGYPNGLKVEIIQRAEPAVRERIRDAMPAMLRPSGFEVSFKLLSRPEYLQRFTGANFGVLGLVHASGITFPVEVGFTRYHSSNAPYPNYSSTKDPELDTLMDTMLQTADEAERLKILRQIQIRWADQAFQVMLPGINQFHGVSLRLQGHLRVNSETLRVARGVLFRDIWVTN